MKYNKRIEEYNSLIDKDNKRKRSLVHVSGNIMVIISFVLIWIWFDWKLALILYLFGLGIILQIEKNIKSMKKKNSLYDWLVLGLVTVITLFLIFGCSSTKMVQSKYGFVHKYQIEEIERIRSNNQ